MCTLSVCVQVYIFVTHVYVCVCVSLTPCTLYNQKVWRIGGLVPKVCLAEIVLADRIFVEREIKVKSWQIKLWWWT